MGYPFNFGKHTLTDVLNLIRYATLVYSWIIEGYSLSILRKKARIAINPIGRVSNLRKRSATKKSALTM